MLKVYRGSDGDIEPVELECEIYGYPNRTTDGEQMYDNTHFRTERAAWDSIRRSWRAGISLTASALKEARAHEEKLTRMLADETLKQQESEEKYKEWFEKHPTNKLVTVKQVRKHIGKQYTASAIKILFDYSSNTYICDTVLFKRGWLKKLDERKGVALYEIVEGEHF